MFSLIIITTFATIALVVMSIFWLFSRQNSVVAARLEKMDPTLAGADEGAFAVLAERVAAPINQLLPPSAVEAGKLQKQLMQAGFRSPDAPVTFRAVQLVMFVALPCAALLAGYVFNLTLSFFFVWMMLGAVMGFYLPRYVLRRMILGRQQRLTWGLADALDLMVIAVEAGLGLNAALVKVGEELREVHPDISQEFEMVNLEIRVGRKREDALRNLVERTGVDDLRSFVALLIQADRFGSSIAKAVRVFADSLRTKRRQRAEQASQKAALKLLFPLTIFLFPTIIIIVLAPSVLNLIDLFSGK